nr:IS3 family transposase [Pseudonocardia sp. ICBG1293]
MARFIADQRTFHRVPHTLACALLGVSISWLYKWLSRATSPGGGLTATEERRRALDAAVRAGFDAAERLHGSPRLHADLREAGWKVSEKTVADSMRRQSLVARRIRRRNGLTRQDKAAPKFPDLLNRDFTAAEPNRRWVGDMTEIPTAAGKLYLATVIDLYSRRLLGAATGLHPNAELACEAIRMAVAARGGADGIAGVIFHTDRGSTYTAGAFATLCRRLDIRQSMGRVVFRQRRGGGVLLQPGVGSAVPQRLRHHCEGSGGGYRLVLRLLQPPATTQRRRRARTDRLRERRPHSRRGIGNPPRSRGNHTLMILRSLPPARKPPNSMSHYT